MASAVIHSLFDAPPRTEREQLLNTLLGQLEGMVYRCRDDEFWTMEFVSEGCHALTGYRPEELLMNGRVSYEEVTHPEDRGRVREEIHAAIAQRRPFDIEYRICRADRAVRWVWERGAAVFAPDGKLMAIQGFVQDITRRRESEQALRDAEARYRSIFENVTNGIFQTTREGRYLRANSELARIYGYDSPEELIAAFSDIGRQLYVDPGRRDEFVRLMREGKAVKDFESQIYRRDGSVIWISESAREVGAPDGTFLHYEGTVEDITERKSYESRIAHQATHDLLTGLPNRALLMDRIEQAVRFAAREGTNVAVAFVDLDHFKYINDSVGHQAGDALIRKMAERLRGSMRDTDTVARLGGDEFVLLLPLVRNAGDTVMQAMQRVLAAVSERCDVEGREFLVSCSIGVSLFPKDGADADTLLKHADSAMYQAKQSGRNNFQFFTREMNQSLVERGDIEQQLRGAIKDGLFELHYQPKIRVSDQAVSGVEALIRWNAPHRGLVSPARFIPIAEETGMIERIGEWVLETACRQIREWSLRGCAVVPVSVNVSPRQFRETQLARIVESILVRTSVAPERLEIEITESCLAHDPQRFLATLHSLKALGVSIAIDDFGAGYSSMSYLKSLPVDRLKIDQSFVAGLTSNAKDDAIFKAIVSLAHNLGLSVVAEGVETQAQWEYLREIGCDEIQGFFFSMPLPAAGLVRLLGR
jgi:diguanylate cyclase (GGDEF)-like protein/PAS domain S-box-containing protein